MQPFARAGLWAGFIPVMFALLADLAMSAGFLPASRAGGLSNPDSYMRLVRLRDMLRVGTVLDSVARDGSGHGTVLHWSHLIDSLLCALAAPFSLFLQPDDALHAAALVFGPLNLAALGFAVAWAAAPFAERKWLVLGAILPALSPAIIGYGMVGVVHHHVAVAVVAVVCCGWTARLITGQARPDAGIALGVWAALGLWFTPESVPLSLLAFGALWLAWIAYPTRAGIPRAIGLTGLSFALVTTLALLADPPAAGVGAMEIDRLSILFAGLACAVAATGAGLWAVHGRLPRPWPRFAAACAIGLGCCAVWAVLCRDAIFSANMLLAADQRDAMFGHVSEMQPITAVLPWLQFLLTGLCATLAAIAIAARRRSLLLGYVAVCLAGLLVAGWSHARFAACPEAAGAIALPVTLTLVAAATSRWHQIGQSFIRLATILLFIQVPFLGQFPDLTGSAYAAPIAMFSACKVADAIAMLAPHPGAVVLADVNDTPELLYKTQVRTVGSLYHRGIAGFLRLRAAWRAPLSAAVPPEIDAAEISLVLGCETPVRSPMVEGLPGTTLFDQVRTAHPPPWLRRINENPASGLVLYEVVRPGDPLP